MANKKNHKWQNMGTHQKCTTCGLHKQTGDMRINGVLKTVNFYFIGGKWDTVKPNCTNAK
jgi:hypothetical protein